LALWQRRRRRLPSRLRVCTYNRSCFYVVKERQIEDNVLQQESLTAAKPYEEIYISELVIMVTYA